MAAIGRQIEVEHGMKPAFRVGLHSGPLIIGAVGDDRKMKVTALGDTVNLAARLETEAENGTVLMSEAMHGLVAGYVDCEFAGSRIIKGKSEPQKMFRLDAVKTGVSRFDVSRQRGLTPLLGRDRELAALEAVWAETQAGNLRIVDIDGQAGIGKSRLVHEFRTRLDDAVFVLDGNCAADGHSVPFLPFTDMVRRSFAFTRDAGPDEARRRLRRGLEVLGLGANDHLPYLLRLLGHEAGDDALDRVADEVIGIRTRNAILAMVRERCRLAPTVMIIEDLHWIDSASEALLSWAASSGEALPLLVVLTHRPAYQPPWRSGQGVINFKVEPLSRDATAELIKKRLGIEELPEGLSRLATDKAEGNPLFAEEITNYLIDAGTPGEDGTTFAVASQPGALALSIGLENMLLHRFDRLAVGPRSALEAASVLGQRFAPDILGEVTGLADEVAPHLDILERQELIFSLHGGDEYRFKHALVQDAVYNSLLTPNREALHERAAEVIERRREDRLMEVADILAYHYSHTRRTEKAIRYLALAGEKSLGVYSLDEAKQRFDQALALIDEAPDSVDDTFLADLLLNIARVNYYRTNLKDSISLADRYLARVESFGDKRRTSRLLFELGFAKLLAGRTREGKPMLERALAIGEEIDDAEAIGYACMGLMWNYIFWEPGTEERRTIFQQLGERAYAAAKQTGDNWLTTKTLGALSNEAALWGRPDRVRQFDQQLLELSERTNDPRVRSETLFRIAFSRAGSGDYEEAVQLADESLRISLCPMDRLFARHAKGLSLAAMGRAEDGYDVLASVRADMESGGLLQNGLMVEIPFGAAMVAKGDMARGIRHIVNSAKMYAQFGQPFATTFSHWMLGEIYGRMMIRDTKVTPWIIIKNIGFLLRTLPFVGWKAQRHLEICVRQSRDLDMPGFLAGSLSNLGVVYLARKNKPAARASLEEARAMAVAFDAKYLIDRIDGALHELAG
jgi:tetratricopeptide (TPR) repeat protein